VGQPKEKAAFEDMISYSPLRQYRGKTSELSWSELVQRQSGDVWEPAKYVAKMRATRTDHHLDYMKTKTAARLPWRSFGTL